MFGLSYQKDPVDLLGIYHLRDFCFLHVPAHTSAEPYVDPGRRGLQTRPHIGDTFHLMLNERLLYGA